MSIPIELRGRETPARLPDLFAPVARGTEGPRDEFLPAGFLAPRRTVDVGPVARSAEGAADTCHDAADGEVLVLELADGGTLVTSAARLRDALRRSRPELVAPDGTLRLDRLRELGETSRGFGEAIGSLVSKVFSFGVQDEADSGILAEAARQFGGERALLGVSWLGTKALMWAIEKRLPNGPGLYAWNGGDALAREPLARLDARIAADPEHHPLLVFLHGTASSTLGSFGDLRKAGREVWLALEQRFPGGIYAFEHRTLSESPIDNALALLELLPPGARVSLVSHSRGGLVGDLLCLRDIGDEAIGRYRHTLEGTGDADPDEARRVIGELRDQHAEQRGTLQRLAQALRDRRLVVQRYVRVACPAAGTKLASGNFDLFLSGLLTLVGRVPGLYGSPYYAAFKRVVVEIARNRTNARMVPGIEAMLPDAPLAQLLHGGEVASGIAMSVIAGDIEGGTRLLQRLGVLLVDHLLFERSDNDLVVDTPAMLAGIAPAAGAKVRFDRGGDVSHFRYFENLDTRDALQQWLLADDAATVALFDALPGPGEYAAALAAAAATRDVGAEERPLVIVLPGVMGTHLGRQAAPGQVERVWFDPLDLARGGLEKIAWERGDVVTDDLFGMFYGKLCKHLAASHRVARFAYDWRQPLDTLADQLAKLLKAELARSPQPVRLLAHSMGGLVVRACIHRHREVMDALMARDGARLVMLGTPNQGAYSMVANLLGKGDTLRTLVRLDLKHDMQQVLDLVAGFRGALQLLPKPGFRDQFQGQDDGGADGWEFQKASTWDTLAQRNRDLWFGNGRAGRPSQAVLDAASWLWARDGAGRPSLPPAYEAKSVYVFGVAPNTPCGLREVDGRLRLVGTTRGDGTVSWESGRIGGIGAFYYMAAEHGDLPAVEEHFAALLELLDAGRTTRLPTTPPAVRAIEQPAPLTYDAGPPAVEDDDTVQRRLLGASPRRRSAAAGTQRRLDVAVHAVDLRFVAEPLLVGHYDRDPIAGPQAVIDQELLDHALSERHRLGLYAGPIGSATAVLERVPGSDAEPRLRGAVVTGLGSYDRPLTQVQLTEAVRAGVLRYLLHTIDVLGREPRELTLGALLIGYNSSANLSVADSVEALVRGVIEANARFRETTRVAVGVRRLNLIELYLDTAITAAYAVHRLDKRLGAEAAALGVQLGCAGEMVRHDSARARLFDGASASYWPRLLVVDAKTRDEDDSPPEPAIRQNAAALPAAPAPGQPAYPERLRFVYIGQRARAETVVQQRQPGLVERLVRDQIASTVWQDDFGRMLFQLMVPHDFKDAARQLARVVLVVDRFTANLPWELMLAEDPDRPGSDRRPLALRTRLVRQLATGSFRRQVRQSIGKAALVVGNPSLEGFEKAFPGPPDKPTKPPPLLPGAETEAGIVRNVLAGMGYEVTAVIGEDQPAKNVFAALFQRPWRIVHVSAHGVFELMHADGRKRSGVLLSDGLLLSAAEIAQMELVPELVFLNCCHLGKLDQRDGNKLAASVARELIEIGVRCVVVAGWAVNDQGAHLFGQTFYEALLQRGQCFGDAVFEARERLWKDNPTDITWGAFQAYGDPGWRADLRAPGGDGAASAEPFVSPEELLDQLARRRVELARRRRPLTDGERRLQAAGLKALVEQRCPRAWAALPEVQAALAATWRELRDFPRAREAYLAALKVPDERGVVPLRAVEQLANLEARLGAAGDIALLVSAITRLEGLDRAILPAPGTADAPVPRSVESASLFGSTYKRLAGHYARALQEPASAAGAPGVTREDLRRALERSAAQYRAAAAGPEPAPYPVLNQLALEALLASGMPDAPAAGVAAARAAGLAARASFERSRSVWDAVMQPEALLVEHLLDGTLAQDGATGEALLEDIAAAYEAVLGRVVITPSELDSVLTQFELLASCCAALAGGLSGEAAARTGVLGTRLQALAQRLRGGAPARAPRRTRRKTQ